jgi:peptidoglycan/xylan/chitin deacetylase (PgdA/CDA1 family)
MNRYVSVILSVLLIFSVAPTTAAEIVPPSIYVNDKKIDFDVPPKIVNGRTLVPMRAIFEALGAEISWDANTQTVYGSFIERSVEYRIGSLTALVNEAEAERTVTLDVPGQIIGGRTMVPLRSISESLGMYVDWHEDVRAITVSKEKPRKIHYIDKVLVLMYHHIDEKEKGVTISQDRFRDHMKALKDAGYNVISVERYIDFIEGERDIPPNAVVITFDDGYESFYTEAFPVLKEFGFPAAHFVVVKLTDSPPPNWVPHMKWEQMREMKEAGMSFYNHTYDLHHYAAINEAGDQKPVLANRLYLESERRVETEQEFRQRVKNDLKLAEDRFYEELGNDRKMLCFPFGYYNDTTIEIAEELGFRHFFTIKEGINKQNERLIKRLNAGVAWLKGSDLLRIMEKQHGN